MVNSARYFELFWHYVYACACNKTCPMMCDVIFAGTAGSGIVILPTGRDYYNTCQEPPDKKNPVFSPARSS